MTVAGAWLRDELNINPIAVGPVEGGPAAVRPIMGSRNQA
jgi:acetate kinase